MICKRHKYKRGMIYGDMFTIGGKYKKPLEVACVECGKRRKLNKKEMKELEGK